MAIQFKSIASRFLTITLVLVVLAGAGLGAFLAVRSAGAIRAALDSKGNAVASLLENVGGGYLENFNYLALDGLVEDIAKDPEVGFVVVYDDKKKQLTKQAVPQDTSAFLLFERQLKNASNRPLGMLKIGYRTDGIAKELRANAVIAALGAAIAMALFSAGMIWLIRGITRPLRECVQMTERIARGELDADIAVERTDEIGQLMFSMKSMAERLREVVLNVKAVADNVASGGKQINDNTLQMSQAPRNRRRRPRKRRRLSRKCTPRSGRTPTMPCRPRESRSRAPTTPRKAAMPWRSL